MTLSVACSQNSLLRPEEAFKANWVSMFSFFVLFFFSEKTTRKDRGKKMFGKKDKHTISKNKYIII